MDRHSQASEGWFDGLSKIFERQNSAERYVSWAYIVQMALIALAVIFELLARVLDQGTITFIGLWLAIPAFLSPIVSIGLSIAAVVSHINKNQKFEWPLVILVILFSVILNKFISEESGPDLYRYYLPIFSLSVMLFSIKWFLSVRKKYSD